MSESAAELLPKPVSAQSRDARAVRSGEALRAAMLALLETTPLDQVTVRDICAQAGVHYATFFRHYPSKEALLDEIARDQIDRLIALTMAIRAKSDFAVGFEAVCEYVDEHRALWSVLLNGGAGSAMREEWVRESLAVSEREPRQNHWLPRELGTICAATLIAETIAWWLAQPEGSHSVAEITAILNRLLANSVLAPD